MTQLFFDLDHTLWDFEKNAFESISDIIYELNLEVSASEYPDFYQGFSDINKALWLKLEQGQISHYLIRKDRFKLAFESFGLPCSNEISEKCNELFLQFLPTKKNLIEGAEELLKKLAGHYKLHIITNGFHQVQLNKLANSGLKSYFDVLATNDVAGARKPDPAIFNYALKKANCNPENAIMIGDSYHADILGARNVGIKAIHFAPIPENDQHIHYFHISELAHLTNFI